MDTKLGRMLTYVKWLSPIKLIEDPVILLDHVTNLHGYASTTAVPMTTNSAGQ